MTLKLKTKNSWPAGGFPFVDPKTGMPFDGMSADLRLQTQHVIKHRRANPAIYPPSNVRSFDPLMVQQEIIAYICTLRPDNCTDASRAAAPYFVIDPAPPHGKKCKKCNSENLIADYCKSCAGRRLVAWKCKDCGYDNPK